MALKGLLQNLDAGIKLCYTPSAQVATKADPGATHFKCVAPYQPWHGRNEGRGCLIVFLADLEGQPCPTMELPWLLWMSPEQVLRTARQDVPLRDLLDAGADLVLGAAGNPPQPSCARLTDSQEALGLALGEALPEFYRSLF